jgi:hypothetical protein
MSVVSRWLIAVISSKDTWRGGHSYLDLVGALSVTTKGKVLAMTPSGHDDDVCMFFFTAISWKYAHQIRCFVILHCLNV